VVSVPFEVVAASVSFQIAPPKAARPDPLQASDRFGALVDNGTSSTNSAATPAAVQPPAPPRRGEDSAANTDHPRSRDTTSADPAARNDRDDHDAFARQACDTNADASTQADPPVQAKAGTPKDGGVKSADKPATDKTSKTDASTAAGSAPSDGTAVTTPNANASVVAVAISVTIASTDAPAVTPASGDVTAPTAIGASSAARAQATTAQVAPAIAFAGDAATAVAPAAAVATADTAAVAATAKTAVQAAAGEIAVTPPNQQATQIVAAAVSTTATAATEAALTASVAATPLAAPKTTSLKNTVADPAKTTAKGTPDTISAAPDPSAGTKPAEPGRDGAAQQPVIAARQQAGGDIVDPAKADATAAPSTSPATAAHDHAPATATANAPTNSADTGAQVNGPLPPQPSPPTTTAPAVPLVVTLATNAPVPLNGLALEIAASARAGKSRFDIRLDPADLGRIDVRIDVDRNGQVTSHLTVEKPETLSMLRQDAPQLQRALDDAGFKTGDGGLQFSLRDQPSSGQNNGNEAGRNAQRLLIADEDTITAAIAGQTYGRVLGSSSGVDIRV